MDNPWSDILEDGASGIKGYVYEPYLCIIFGVLLSSCQRLRSSRMLRCKHHVKLDGVVVGDPKMSPYADIVHDIEIIDVRILTMFLKAKISK